MVGACVVVGERVSVGAGDGMAVGFRETVGSPVGAEEIVGIAVGGRTGAAVGSADEEGAKVGAMVGTGVQMYLVYRAEGYTSSVPSEVLS